MSWFNKNYDKVIMGLAFATLAGVGAASMLGGTATDTSTKAGKEGEKYPWEGLKDEVKATSDALAAPAATTGKVWVPVKLNPTQTARLFQGPALVQKAGDESAPFDALDPAAEKLRGEVPNSWLIENGLDITRSKILTRDDDGDKYTNQEEFVGGSNPRDQNSVPSKVLKLKLVEIVGLKCELRFRASDAELQIKRTREDAPGTETSRSNLNAKVGSPIFGADESDRFTLVSVTEEKADDGKVIKVAEISDSLNKVGSPFKVKDSETVNRPTQTAKVLCNFDGTEEIIAKEGGALSFKAFGSTTIKLAKIDPVSQSIEIEFAEGGEAAKTHQIKKD